MTRPRLVGTREERADREEQIPASEFRQFMQEMRDFKTDLQEFKEGVVRVLDSIQDDMTILLKDMGEIRERSNRNGQT